MAETLDAALEALRRDQCDKEMAAADAALRPNPQQWSHYVAERDAWLNADLS